MLENVNGTHLAMASGIRVQQKKHFSLFDLLDFRFIGLRILQCSKSGQTTTTFVMMARQFLLVLIKRKLFLSFVPILNHYQWK